MLELNKTIGKKKIISSNIQINGCFMIIRTKNTDFRLQISESKKHFYTDQKKIHSFYTNKNIFKHVLLWTTIKDGEMDIRVTHTELP